MNRIILALAVLTTLALLAESRSMVNLGGEDGNQIFVGLTNNSTSNSTLNLSENSSLPFLGGEEGNSLLKDLANDSENLSEWGKPPQKSPLPPTYDPKMANTIAILRANHGF
jgi:hypothetical protein